MIRPLTSADRKTVRDFTAERWGEPRVVGHGTVYVPETLPGFVAEAEGRWIGWVTYTIEGDACEVVTLDSLTESHGVGTALLGAVEAAAREAGCARLWLITTNDNLNALRFYQKRGLALVAVHRDAVTRARLIKPSIPMTGDFGIPLRDEIELEMRL